MEKYFKHIRSFGLPGGANELKISTQGYKSTSPDKDQSSLLIPSSNITMEGVSHPVKGVDDLGNEKIMMPGMDYTFPGNYVHETPIRQQGGGTNDLSYDERMKQDTLKKQQIADRFYNFSGPDSLYKNKKLYPDDPQYKQYWNPSRYTGLEAEVMAEYQPDFIYVNPEVPNYSHPQFTKKYQASIPQPISDKADRLDPRVSRPQAQPTRDSVNVPKSNLNLHKEFNPYTKEYEPMSPQQKNMLERSKYKGENMPEFKRDLKNAVSREDVTLNQKGQYQASNPNEYPELASTIQGMSKALLGSKRNNKNDMAVNSERVTFKDGGEVMELSDEEIEQYKQAGYKVEYL